MTETIPEHKHCRICGKQTSKGKDFCSDKCQQEFEDEEKTRKRFFIMILVLPAIFIVLMILFLV